MKKFELSVKRYRDKLEQEFGFADPDVIKKYAEDRRQHKLKFNPFTDDQNCKTCKKKRD